MATISTISDEGLSDFFDKVVIAALRQWAEGKGASVRLPGKRWRAEGRTGSVLVAIVVAWPDGSSHKIIVKVLPSGEYGRETGRHEMAWKLTPDFARRHLVEQFDSRYPVDDGRFLMFQETPGSLLESHTLSRLPDEHLPMACQRTALLILDDWNKADPHPAVGHTTVGKYLRAELGEALAEDRSAYRWISKAGLLDAGDWIITSEDGNERPMPNPVRLLSENSSIGMIGIDYLIGRTHGDLHLDNALIPYNPPQPPRFDDIRLVDLSTFNAEAPLSRDIVALILSVLAQEVSDPMSDAAADALLAFAVSPTADVPPQLRRVIAEAVWSIYKPGRDLFKQWQDEWRAQYLLSIVAQSLVYTSFDNIGPHGRWWYFRLATRAAHAFLETQSDTPPPSQPRRIDKPSHTSPPQSLDGPNGRFGRRPLAKVIGATGILGVVGGGAYAVRQMFLDESSADPVTASARYLWFPEDGLMFATNKLLSPQDIQRIEQSVGSELAEKTAMSLGMVHVASLFDEQGPISQYSRLQIVLEGSSDEPVVIQEIKAHVINSTSSLTGAILFGPSQGERQVAKIAFDLDSADPIARIPEDDGSPSKTPYAAENYITLTKKENIVLLANAHTKSRYCEWEIHLIIEGQREPQVVRNLDGRPFRTTAFSDTNYHAAYVYNLANGRFVQHNPQLEAPWVRGLDR